MKCVVCQEETSFRRTFWGPDFFDNYGIPVCSDCNKVVSDDELHTLRDKERSDTHQFDTCHTLTIQVSQRTYEWLEYLIKYDKKMYPKNSSTVELWAEVILEDQAEKYNTIHFSRDVFAWLQSPETFSIIEDQVRRLRRIHKE